MNADNMPCRQDLHHADDLKDLQAVFAPASEPTSRLRRRMLGLIGVAVSLVVTLALTGCGAGPDSGNQPEDVLTDGTVTSDEPPRNPADVAPGDELVVFDVGQEPARPPVARTPATEEERERSENPELVNADRPASGRLPEGVEVPDAAELVTEASRLDGYRSFVVLRFDVPWADAVGIVRASLERGGWECYECIPFVAGEVTPEPAKEYRYFLNMQRDGRRVVTIFAENRAGVVASLTFQG